MSFFFSWGTNAFCRCNTFSCQARSLLICDFHLTWVKNKMEDISSVGAKNLLDVRSTPEKFWRTWEPESQTWENGPAELCPVGGTSSALKESPPSARVGMDWINAPHQVAPLSHWECGLSQGWHHLDTAAVTWLCRYAWASPELLVNHKRLKSREFRILHLLDFCPLGSKQNQIEIHFSFVIL